MASSPSPGRQNGVTDSGRDKLTEAAQPVLEHQALVGQPSLSADWTEVPRKGSLGLRGEQPDQRTQRHLFGGGRCFVRIMIRYTWTRSGPTLPSKSES